MRHCPHCGREVSPAATRCPACGAPLEADPSRAAKKGSHAVLWIAAAVGCGFLLLAVLGIVAAIVIPNFLDATQKAKQKRSLADLRMLAVAIEEYRGDHDGDVPPADSVDELAGYLEPDYQETVLRTDAWRHPILYVCWPEDPSDLPAGTCDAYRLVSPGRDGVFEHEDASQYSEGAFSPTDYDRDLVVADGYLWQYPASPPG